MRKAFIRKTWFKFVICVALIAALLPVNITLAVDADGNSLRIDNQNRYSGMASSYHDGYMPTVQNGRVTVYLPLVSSESIIGSEIIVTPNFGEPSSSPFILTNTQKTVRLALHALANGGQAQSYLLTFDAALKKDHTNGQYPITFNVRYSTVNDDYAQTFTVYALINDVIEPIGGDALRVDTLNRYAGMDTSYSEGYMPSIKNGKVTVILPLITSEDISGNEILATPDLGEPSSSPFVLSNIQKPVRLMRHALLNGGQSNAYLLTFDAALKKDHTNGQYPITVNVSYFTGASRHSQAFTVYVLVDDVTEPADGELLRVDNQNTYPGMECSYENGYLPSAKNDKVTVYLPLVTQENLTDSQILVTPNFGEASASPFVVNNAQKTVRLAKYSLSNGGQADAYLLVFTASLKENRVNGQYPLMFDVRYRSASGSHSQTFTVFVSVGDMVGDILRIDNRNKYGTMGTSYGQGYMPLVKNGKVTIYLPLVASKSIVDRKIYATPNLGETAASPFIFANTQKTVSLAKHTLADNSQTEAYLLVFTGLLKSDRANGQYPVTFNVNYFTASGAQAQTFTIYVSVTDGKDPNAVPTAPPSEQPLSQPKTMLESYTVSPNPAIAGQPVDISMTLRNTNAEQAIQNIKVTLKSEGQVVPSGDNGTRFIEKLDKKESVSLTFHLKERPDVKPEPQKLSLTIAYEDDKAAAITAEEELIIEVSQPMKLEIDTPKIPTSVNAGDTIPVTMGVFNLGKGMVYNVLCKLEAPGLLAESSVFLGNMESGASKNCEFSVSVGAQDMSVSENMDGEGGDAGQAQEMFDTGQYGPIAGEIIVMYEDEFGIQEQKEIEISTEIIQPMIQDEIPVITEPEEPPSSWQLPVIISAAAVAVLTGGIVIYKKRRRMAEDADD